MRNEIHLEPECHPDDLHTTKDCWCQPIRTDLNLGLWRSEHVVFHREAARTNEGETE